MGLSPIIGPLKNFLDNINLQQELAEKFAPIVYHSSDESNYPTNVDWFLSKTELWFHDVIPVQSPQSPLPLPYSPPPPLSPITVPWKVLIIKAPNQDHLVSQHYTGNFGAADTFYSYGTRSKGKHQTFYLKDVAEVYRVGSMNSRDWTTYFHAYPNIQGGITIQYWRFYAYNDAVNNHGGDWEGLHMVLDSSHNPNEIVLLQHGNLKCLSPIKFEWEGSHILVFSEGGGHATRSSGEDINAKGGDGHINPNIQATFSRQETWTGGKVAWHNGEITDSGQLLNVGSKTNPMNGQAFIKYSGLWGSPGTFFGTSGYWGPAYNENDMKEDGFITAWGMGMAGTPEFIRKECYPLAESK